MKVSVITITYNSAATVEATIRSVLAQKTDDVEYIIVDGKSKDNTMEVVNKYRSQLAHVISEPDKGISDAFNKGIRLASGDLIVLVNSDDELLPDAISSVLACAQDSADVIHGNVIAQDEKGNTKIKKPNCSYELLRTEGMYLNHPGMFIRKRAYEKWGTYSVEYRCGMDRELLARFVENGAVFQYIDKEFALFQSGGESTKSFIKHGLPESRRISLAHGVHPVKVEFMCLKKMVLFLGSMAKRRILWIIKGQTKK